MAYREYDLSQFPDEIDVFQDKEDLKQRDKHLVEEYHNLWDKVNKTAEDIDRLNDLSVTLDKYLYTAEHINKFQHAVTKTQRFFKEESEGFVDNLQTETRQYVDDKKIEFMDEVDKFAYKGAYSNLAQYQERNIVDYNDGASNQSYMALEPVKGVVPTDTNKWLKLTIQGTQGERGVDGLGLKFKGAYDQNSVYGEDDGVQYGGVLFGSLVNNNIGELPNITMDTDYWARAMSASVTVQKMVGVRNIVTATNSVNFMAGEIIAFNPSVDSLEVYQNSVRLTKDIDYKLGADNKTIEKIGGAWQASSNNPIFFEFVVTKNVANDLVFNDGSGIQEGTVREVALEVGTRNKLTAMSTSKPTDKTGFWFEVVG